MTISRCLTLLALLGACLAPLAAYAQVEQSVLAITLRDTTGAAIAGARVSVRDLSGHELAQAATDVHGRASFDTLPVSELLVGIEGMVSSHTPLYLPGQDAPGIRVLLDGPPVQLDLRAEADGLVRPDPATMLAPDSALPAGVVLPEQPVPTTAAPITVPPAPTVALVSTEPEVATSFSWLAVFLLVFLSGAATLALALVRRRRDV